MGWLQQQQLTEFHTETASYSNVVSVPKTDVSSSHTKVAVCSDGAIIIYSHVVNIRAVNTHNAIGDVMERNTTRAGLNRVRL